jgi:hypothetical protein
VPLRIAPLGQLAPTRPFSDTRRRLAAVAQGRNGTHTGSNGTAPAEPGFRAPWGEVERQIPYVVITTQPWPMEWWRPPQSREAAARRASDQPADLLARPAAQAAPPLLPEATVGIRVWDTPAHTSAHEPVGMRVAPRKNTEPRSTVRRARAQQKRRGLFTRLAVVAVGLIVSLIAVETATRRRG